MTVTIALPPTVEQKLREQAAASGKDVEAFVLEAVEEKLAGQAEAQAASVSQRLSPAEREQRFGEWMREVEGRASRYPPGFVADDSRESIYEGCGE